MGKLKYVYKNYHKYMMLMLIDEYRHTVSFMFIICIWWLTSLFLQVSFSVSGNLEDYFV